MITKEGLLKALAAASAPVLFTQQKGNETTTDNKTQPTVFLVGIIRIGKYTITGMKNERHNDGTCVSVEYGRRRVPIADFQGEEGTEIFNYMLTKSLSDETLFNAATEGDPEEDVRRGTKETKEAIKIMKLVLESGTEILKSDELKGFIKEGINIAVESKKQSSIWTQMWEKAFPTKKKTKKTKKS